MKRLKLLSLLMIVISAIFILNGCEKSSSNASNKMNQPTDGSEVLGREIKVSKDNLTLYPNISGYESENIIVSIVPSSTTKDEISFSVSNNEIVKVEKISNSEIKVTGLNKAGNTKVTIYLTSNKDVKKDVNINVSLSNSLPSNPSINVVWSDLPETPVRSSTTVFDEKDYINKSQIDDIKEDISEIENALLLIARYQIINVSVKGPNGNPVVIDNVVGSGDNMRGEFMVNAVPCAGLNLTCFEEGVNLTIKMKLQMEFHNDLMKQGIPESLQYINTDIYSPLQSQDVAAEFGRLSPIINETNKTVTFILNSSQLKQYIPNGYTMEIVLKKVENQTLANMPEDFSSPRYFSEATDVYRVRINNKVTNLVVGDTHNLNWSVFPESAVDKSVTFTSSAEDVVKVSREGVLTALKSGLATITVRTNDGGFEDSFQITVENKYIPVERITPNMGTVTLDVDRKVNNLSADVIINVYPTDATNKKLKLINNEPLKIQAEIIEDNKLAITALSKTETPVVLEIEAEDTTNSAKTQVTVRVTDSTKYVERVSFSEANKNVKIGDSNFTLTPNIEPTDAYNKKVTYHSSNVSVATVNKDTGEVTIGSTTGVATITATSTDGSNVSGSYTVNVARKDIDVESISISPNNITISENSSETKLNVVYTPSDANINKEVTFTANTNEFINLDVSTGVIRPIKAGTTIVTATTTNGKVATATIVVAGDVVEVTGVSITNKDTLDDILQVNETATINYSVTPKDATSKDVIFEVKDNSDVVEVSETGIVTAKRYGTATVIVKSASNNEIKDEFTFTVWEKLDISGTYNVSKINLTLNGERIEFDTIGTKYITDKIAFAIKTAENDLEVTAKYQLSWGHFVRNPEWDVFRFNYIKHNDSNLPETSMTKEKYLEKNITINEDGSIKYVFPFTFNGESLTYSENSSNKVEFILNERTGNYNQINNSKFLEVLPVNENDPYSLQGTYNMTFFGTIPQVNSCSGFVCFIAKGEAQKPVTSSCSTYSGVSYLTQYSNECSAGTNKNEVTNFKGIITITKAAANSRGLIIRSKVTMTNNTMASNAKDDQYQYTKYTTTSNSDDFKNRSNSVRGVAGRNLTTTTSNMESPFNISGASSSGESNPGQVKIDLHLKGKQVSAWGADMDLDSYTHVIGDKIKNTPDVLDPNSMSDLGYSISDFSSNVGYADNH